MSLTTMTHKKGEEAVEKAEIPLWYQPQTTFQRNEANSLSTTERASQYHTQKMEKADFLFSAASHFAKFKLAFPLRAKDIQGDSQVTNLVAFRGFRQVPSIHIDLNALEQQLG